MMSLNDLKQNLRGPESISQTMNLKIFPTENHISLSALTLIKVTQIQNG